MSATLLSEKSEGSTPNYTLTFVLKDAAGVVLPAVTFTAVRLTFYSLHTGAIVNGRVGQNVLNANNVAISAGAVLVWKLMEADTILVDTPKPILGHHCAVFVFEWQDAEGGERQETHKAIFPIRRADFAPFAA